MCLDDRRDKRRWRKRRRKVKRKKDTNAANIDVEKSFANPLPGEKRSFAMRNLAPVRDRATSNPVTFPAYRSNVFSNSEPLYFPIEFSFRNTTTETSFFHETYRIKIGKVCGAILILSRETIRNYWFSMESISSKLDRDVRSRESDCATLSVL